MRQSITRWCNHKSSESPSLRPQQYPAGRARRQKILARSGLPVRRARRAQVPPAERLNRRFAQSPIDALIDIQVGCRLRRQIPVRLDPNTRADLPGLRRSLLRRCCQGHSRHRSPQWRVGCQRTKVAMPVGAWRWRQGRDAVDQLQWRESQLVRFDATLVTRRFAVLFGAAVHLGSARFAQPIHSKGWASAVPQ